jgi:hypothetical protein
MQIAVPQVGGRGNSKLHINHLNPVRRERQREEKRGEVVTVHFNGDRKKVSCLEGSQTVPTRPSGRSIFE